MSDEQQSPQTETDETQAASETAPPDNADDKKKPAPRKRGSRIWALLLMLVVLAGLVALLYWYERVHPNVLGMLHLTEHAAPPTTGESPASVPAPAKTPVAKAPETAPGDHQTEAAPVAPARPATPLSAQQAAQLMTAIQQLQDQLQQLRSNNEQLHKALAEQQRLDLRSRLRLIADPATRLPQLALLWQDVSLSPVLSANQRNEAISMTAAAREALTQNQQWQQRLDVWIARLAEQESGPDLIPHFDHPWLAWLARQFHFRPAPTNGSSGSQVLRQKLIRIRHGMAIESWPETKVWQPLRAELILINASSAKAGGKTAQLGLPNNFTAMRQAVAALHETAHQWLESNP